MKLPIHIIREKARREEMRRRREEGAYIPIHVPEPNPRKDRLQEEDPKQKVIVIQL